MDMRFVLKPVAVAATVLLLSAALAATISKADYQASKTRISADYKADKAACVMLAANAKDVCMEEAKAKEKVSLAVLDYSFTVKSNDRSKVLVAKAESTYAVAKEKCDDRDGNDKDVCVKEAKAVEVISLVDAKLGKVIGEATKGAIEEKRDADYKGAIEKCDTLAGDAKTACVTAARAKFSKN